MFDVKKGDIMKKPYLIAITGGSGSGKTSIAQAVCDHFKKTNSVYVLRQDDYYNDQKEMSMAERLKVNYDHPAAFDNALMVQQLKELKMGQTIKKPTYDFVEYTRKDEVELIEPTDVIIVEGLLVLENEKLRDLYDLKIFVDTDADERLIRRINRDVKKRGRSLDSVINQYLSTVKEMHYRFVEPTKRYANVIITKGRENVQAVDLIITKIASILS